MPRRNRSKRKQTDPLFHEVSEDSDRLDNVLQIGGVRVRVGAGGNVAGMTRQGTMHRTRQQQHTHAARPISSSARDSDIEDYVQNVEQADSASSADEHHDSGDEDPAHIRRAYAWQQLEMLRRFSDVELGHEGAVEDIVGFETDAESSDDAEGEGGENEACSIESDGTDSSDQDQDSSDSGSFRSASQLDEDSAAVLTSEDLALLSPEQRYPVQFRPGSFTSPTEGKPKARRSAVKGAKGGKLAPGEKARLRRAKIEQRRGQRAAARGLDLADINRQLQEFVVAGDNDVVVFPPMQKKDCQQVGKLVALYGCKSGAQGSGKKRSVVVTRTQHACQPNDEALLKIGRLLALQNVEELGSSAAAYSQLVAGSGSGGNKKKGRWADALHGRSNGKKALQRLRGAQQMDVSSDAEWMPMTSTRTKSNNAPRSKQGKGITFVSCGAIHAESEEEVEVVVAGSSIPIISKNSNIGTSSHKVLENPSATNTGSDSVSVDVLPVFEDRGGASTHSDEDLVYEVAINETNAAQNRRRSDMAEFSARGAAAAEGITNSGRLVGLGMALGIGAEIFGVPAAADLNGYINNDNRYSTADLSPLQPQLSKSQQRKLRKKGLAGGHAGEQQRTPRGAATVANDFTEWERHTNGVGSRLLAKWGYNGPGAGLGRSGKGIAEPLEVRQRAKGRGLGAEHL